MQTRMRHDLPQLDGETDAGATLVDAATGFAEEFVEGAHDHDRDGTFATEHLEKLRVGGFLGAAVPGELGGGDVGSIRDLLVASSRLARGDAALTIGVNMHIAVTLNIVRTWRSARHRGEHRRATAIGAVLRSVATGDVVFASAASEPSPQDLTRPTTTATRTADGWRIDGRKAFATMAPAATVLSVAVGFVDDAGADRYGFAFVPTSAPGIEFHDDWDALGMRASASGSVSFHDVRIDASGLRDGFPAGHYSAALLDRYLPSGAFHAAASLGVAESAHVRSVASLRARAEAAIDDPFTVVRLAENVVDVTAMQATLDRAGRVIDDYAARNVATPATLDDAQDVFAQVQAAKAFITATAVRVVDRALALSGGAGYLASHPLAKAWRDVRAGGFMHPTGANRADSLLARAALGLPPG